MNTPENQSLTEEPSIPNRSGNRSLIFVSILVFLITFFLSNSILDLKLKTIIFALIVISYLIFCAVSYRRQNHRNNFTATETEAPSTKFENVFSSEIQEKLFVLEEANSFLATSLKPADMFRLVSNRIADLIPFTNCVLFLPVENASHLKAIEAAGRNAPEFLELQISNFEGLAGKAFHSRKAQADDKLLLEKETILSGLFNDIKSAVAAPLVLNERNCFGVLALYSEDEKPYNAQTVKLLEAIAARSAPLFWNSLTFERNAENSLTDSLTKLPNERAFYLVLENQIAESHRFREQRPLTVMSIDIRNFDELNKKFGHAAGDRILQMTAKIIKGQLRQMDFLARAGADEFLAILPTASEEITKIIIERIEKALMINPFQIAEHQDLCLQLNFGTSSFAHDGETVQELLKTAIIKKQAAKSEVKGSVLRFPGEYVN